MVKKNTWGRYTRIFFHTVIYKVKNENDYNTINKLKSFINTICNLIPCSTCRNHAMEYLKRNNIDNVKTKTQLKLYMYKFHDYNNKRDGKQTLSINEYDKIYENKITTSVLYNFRVILYNIKYAANYMFLSKKKINFISEYTNYFKNNINKFNL